MTGRQGVSHLARATGAKIGERLLGKAIEPSRFGVALDPWSNRAASNSSNQARNSAN